MAKLSGLNKLVADIKERAVYLLDRETYIESIFDRIKKDIAFVPITVTGVSGTGYDLKGIMCGYPPKYLAIYLNKNHAKLDFYRDHIAAAKKLGYATKFSDDMAHNYPEDYDERFKPFGFQCGMETVFCDQSGNVIGVWGALKSAEVVFAEDEMSAVRQIAPFIFYAFQRYRWLVEADFFTVVCYDEFPLGIVTSDRAGNITYLNEAARQLIGSTGRQAHSVLPARFMEQMRLLDEVPKHYSEPCLIFQEIEAYVPPYGVTVCYRFDEDFGGRYLPVKGSGWVFFIDSRKKDMAQKALISQRELEVIRLIGRGLQDKEIAFELGIAEKTVQTYIQSLFAKLETHNRTEAAVKAIKLGLL